VCGTFSCVLKGDFNCHAGLFVPFQKPANFSRTNMPLLLGARTAQPPHQKRECVNMCVCVPVCA